MTADQLASDQSGGEDHVDRWVLAETELAKAQPAISIETTATTISVTTGQQRILIARKHFFYLREIWTFFDVYFETVVPNTVDGLQTVDYSEPRWHTIRESGETFYFSSIAEEISANRLYKQYLKPISGYVILDLGAYCGLSTIAFARAVGPSGRVIALEPDPQNYDVLATNVARTGLTNVTVAQKAVFGRAGTLMLSSEGNMGSAILRSVEENRGGLVEVQAVTLDQIASDYDLSKVDAVKMDIEGSEYSVVETSYAFFDRFRPRAIIELHANPWPDGPITVGIVRSVFDDLGYDTKFVGPTMMLAVPDLRMAQMPSSRAPNKDAPAAAGPE